MANNRLKDYYDGLPNAVCPKRDFINEVSFRAHVSTGAVTNWIRGMKPRNPEHIKILSEITGIAPEELF